MVGQGNHPQLLASHTVDDTVWKLPKGKRRRFLQDAPNSGCAEQSQGSLELCNEGKTKVGTAFPAIEEGSFG